MFEKRYRFTSNKHSTRGLMALVYGTMSLVSFILSVSLTVADKAQNASRMGAAGFIAMIFGFIGIALGSTALGESDVFPILPRLGFAASVIAVLCWGGIIYVGITGL